MSLDSLAQSRPGLRDTPTVSRRIVMVGTHWETQGGIATVVRGYRDAGLFDRFDVAYVVTHRDGGFATKLVTALRGYLSLLVQLARGGAPLVHVHLSSRASTWRKCIALLLVRAARRPYLLHVHGSEFMQFYEKECGALARSFIRAIFARAAGVIALSDQWRVELARVAPGTEAIVLPNAVPLPEGASARAVAESQAIVFLGRLGERKGVFDLLRAFARIAHRHPAAQLVCAGDGEIGKARELARELGIEAVTSFPGWLDGEATRRVLEGSSIFALPSNAEGMPMALLEAMSWGLVPVVTPVGGIPQVVHHERNGVLVRPGDVDGLARELDSLLEQPRRRTLLGAAARATIAEGYALERAVEQLARLYAQLGVTPRAGSRKNEEEKEGKGLRG